MKYLWTTMHVKNLEESIAFYEEVVGLKLEHRFPAGPGTEIAFMKSEGTETKVELLCRADFDGRREDAALSLGFETKDLDGKMAELKAKGYAVSDVISPNPKSRFFFRKGPQWHRYSVCRRVKEYVNRENSSRKQENRRAGITLQSS